MKIIALMLASIATALCQETPQSNSNSAYISDVVIGSVTQPTTLSIGTVPGDPVMTINTKTGEVTFGKNVTPNEAAKQFAAALRELGMGLGCDGKSAMVPPSGTNGAGDKDVKSAPNGWLP